MSVRWRGGPAAARTAAAVGARTRAGASACLTPALSPGLIIAAAAASAAAAVGAVPPHAGRLGRLGRLLQALREAARDPDGPLQFSVLGACAFLGATASSLTGFGALAPAAPTW